MKKLITILIIMLCFSLVTLSCSSFHHKVSTDSLFYEDWEKGIDNTKWKIWGSPAPFITPGLGINGSNAIDPNGDGTYDSGVTTYQRFTLKPGLAFGVWMYGDQTYTHWQSLKFSLTQRDAEDIHGGRDGIGKAIMGVAIRVETNLKDIVFYLDGKSFKGVYDNSEDGKFHYYSFVINDDYTVSFFKDKQLIWESTNRLNTSLYPSATLSIYGRSYRTKMMADNIKIDFTPPN
jgi:hypothetical protein